MDQQIRQMIIDLHAAMSEEKLGRLPQPRIDRLERAMVKLASSMGPQVEQEVKSVLQMA